MQAIRRIRLRTQGNHDIVDLTGPLEAEIAASGLRNGLATVFVAGSTAGVTTAEFEPGLVVDLKDAFDRLIPRDVAYRHNLTEGDANGHSHVRASMLGPSLVVPVEGGRMTLGTWQQVVLVDFDVRPRSREVVVQLAGE
jgi:secondary thiamine-phosphate synthase enzyme